jgi:hypothetical protein
MSNPEFGPSRSSSSKTPMKWVGTPCSAVHRSSDTVCTVALGSKDYAQYHQLWVVNALADKIDTSDAYTTAAPWTHAARFPNTKRVYVQR